MSKLKFSTKKREHKGTRRKKLYRGKTKSFSHRLRR